MTDYPCGHPRTPENQVRLGNGPRVCKTCRERIDARNAALRADHEAGVDIYELTARYRLSTGRIYALLSDRPTRPAPTLPIPAIIDAAVNASAIPRGDILSDDRSDCFTRVRQAIFWVAVHRAGHTRAGVGRAMNRDHSTVIHGLGKAEARMRAEPYYRRLVERIEERARASVTEQRGRLAAVVERMGLAA